MPETKRQKEERQIKEAFIDGYISALDAACLYQEDARGIFAERAWWEENTTS